MILNVIIVTLLCLNINRKSKPEKRSILMSRMTNELSSTGYNGDFREFTIKIECF